MLMLLSFHSLFAKTIVVAEHTLSLPADSTVSLWYGFAAGDKIEINLAETNGLHLSSFEVSEYPSTSRFSEANLQKLRGKTLVANRTGIYRFSISNHSADSRTCRLLISRTPASRELSDFATSVYWRNVQDTTYTPVEEKYCVQSDTLVQQIYSANPVVPAKTALGSKNYQIVEFILPKNTVSWSFFIGTGDEGKKAYESTAGNYSSRLASIVSRIPEYGPLAALALTGVSYFSTNVQGDDNIKYWFLNDASDVQQFKLEQKFRFYKRGDVVTEASQMRAPLSGRIYLAVLNDNIVESVKLTLRIVAVELNQKWSTRILQKMSITARKEPFLK